MAERLFRKQQVASPILASGSLMIIDVYTHIARIGEFAKKRLQEFMAFAPARKLLYGTDWPLVPMKSYLKFARGLGVKKDDMEYVMYKNAANLYNLETQ